jgi:alpha-tubulin suppressor-like RCC1 family protein
MLYVMNKFDVSCRFTGRIIAVAALVCAAVAGGSVRPDVAVAAGTQPLAVGFNADGQLGDGTTTQRLVPGLVNTPANIVAVASGREHGYALDDAGRVWAWGDNSKGAVGDGTLTDRATPVQLGLTNVVQVEAGHYHGIALRSDGTVYTWGYGGIGQLGLGTLGDRTTPTQVPGLANVVSIAAGRDMTYAVLGGGTVVAWGNNSFGEVGDGTTVRRASPVAVSGITGVVEISGGRNHALARRVDGSMWAWGANDFGQLGVGSFASSSVPVQVLGGPVIDVHAGAEHSLTVLADGTVRSWGRGQRGQLGLGTTATATTPQQVPGLAGITVVGDGRDQSFAMNASGSVWAWGYNDLGQLGDGTTTTRLTPVQLAGLTNVVSAQGGRGMTIFLRTPAVQPPGPTVLVANDFTNGLAGWTVVGSFVADSAVGSPTDEPPSGQVNVVNAVGEARLAIPTPSTEVCAAVDVQVASVAGTARYSLLKLRNSGGSSIGRLEITTAGQLSVRADISATNLTTASTLAAGSWNRVALCATAGATGSLRLFVNGAAAGNWTANTGGQPIAAVQLGDNSARSASARWDALVVTQGPAPA